MTDNSITGLHTVQTHTLGCKLNFSETASMEQMLMEHCGIRRAQPGEHPDICIINTCSVTELADKKCRQAIRKCVKENPGALVVVTGCYSQLKSSDVAAIEGVNIILGNDRKDQLLHAVRQWLQARQQMVDVQPDFRRMTTFVPSCSHGDRTRYFLKVQDGCDYFCTYCTIPFARGRSRNGTIASLVEQARQVAAEGGKEIVLTGVNIGDFGKSTGERFIGLIKALDEVDGIERYRISSIEPDLLTDEIIDWVAQSRRFMPHFHVPLQCGSDEVLRLMNRHYRTALFAHKVERIRAVMPDAFIGVDLIVGARGETAQLFEQSRQFVASLDISRLHVFPYSERPGTAALRIGHVVGHGEKEERVAQMLAISDEKLRQFTSRFIGTCRPALLEHTAAKDGTMHGFTDNYLRVQVPHDAALANTIATVRIDSLTDDVETVNATIV